MKNENDKFKINRDNKSHYIDGNASVYRTDLGKSSKIVSMSNQSTNGSCIKKKNKYEYIDTRTGEIKQYDLNKPVSIKDAKRKVRKYEELVLYNFTGGKNQLFITLTCSEPVTDIRCIKEYYKEFLERLKSDYEDLDCIALFETTVNSYWHIHLFVKSNTQSELFIPHNVILNYYWGYGAVHIIKNLNTFKNLNHSKNNRQEKLERLTQFPKGMRMYSATKGIKTPPKEIKLFKECPEYNSNDYSVTKTETYVIRNESTDKIVNTITTIMYKHNETKQ